MKNVTFLLPALGAAVLFTASARGQYSWSADFNDRLTPAGMILRGNGTIPITGGVGNTACLSLTPAASGYNSDAILPRFWGADETPAEAVIRFSVKMSGNSGGVIGDGYSVSLTEGIPNVIVAEGGVGIGPKMCWDTYDNDGTDGGLSMWWPDGRTHLAPSGPPNRLSSIMTNRNDWYGMEYRAELWSRGSSVKFNGNQLMSRAGRDDVAPVIHPDGRIIFAARTGDAFSAHLFDNLSVTVTPYPIFREQPQSVQVTEGATPAFTAQTNFNTLPWLGIGTFNIAMSATTAWQIRHPGGNWITVPGTTEQVLWGPGAKPRLILNNLRENTGLWEGDDPALSIDGTEVRCVLMWHNGYSVTTNPAVLRLMPLPENQGNAITLFNSFPLGSASVTYPVEQGKVLRLTPAQQNCLGGFVFDEIRRTPQNQPQLVTAFAASFQFRGSLPSSVRADGISFNIGTDVPEGIPGNAGEDGAGSGVTISLDAFANEEDDPVGIDVLWRRQRVARVPMAGLFDDDDWAQLYVRVEPDGTLDVALNGNAVIFNLPLAGWTGFREPRMSFYGRTGFYWQQQDVRQLAVSVTGTPIVEVIPWLIAQKEYDTLRLTWPAAAAEGWTLQQSADQKTWVTAPYPIYAAGTERQVWIFMEASRLFFRLAKNPG